MVKNDTNKWGFDSQHKLLLLGYGNPGRGDDALGVMLVNKISLYQLTHVTCLTDMQLMIEQVVDLQGFERIIFVDANMTCDAPFIFSQIQAIKDESYTSHSLTPAALLYVFQQVYHGISPPAFLMQIRGYDFELGNTLSSSAKKNLGDSVEFINKLIGC